MARLESFRGFCHPCATKARQDGTHRRRAWSRSNVLPERKHNQGYLIRCSRDVSDELLPLFKKMQNRSYTVLEHRWVMALHLGRPLKRNELVDHLNGNKLDNHVENLRIYIQGKDQPGACGGYGTYYHEWQMALARIAELEAQLIAPAHRDKS